jgi:hypothetical protein
LTNRTVQFAFGAAIAILLIVAGFAFRRPRGPAN